MSGITGVFHRDRQPVDRDVLQGMTDAMQRRGPDRRAIWIDGCVGLGHAALFSTLESEHENQPTSIDGSVWIAGDARIDNWNELQRKLEVKGESLSETLTDIELILRAYRVWGTACVDHLLGDFAFVIWDGREQRLVCARDHSGVKPFHYYLSDRLFVFGSEMRALLAMPEVPRRLNEARIADLIVDMLEAVDKTSTFYLDIQRLPPAHLMIIERDRLQLFHYWKLDSTKEIRLKSDREYADAFLDVFQKAVICRLRTPERLASMLSGGLDSSSVVATARQWVTNAGQAPLRTFSAVSSLEGDTETLSSRLVIDQGGLRPNFIRLQELTQYLSEFHAFDDVGDEPFDYYMHIPQVVYIAAKRQGLKVILDGVPGDNVTSISTSYITWMLRQFKVFSALQECRARAKVQGDNAKDLLVLHAKTAYFPERLRAFKRRLVGHTNSMPSNFVHDSLLNPSFAERVKVADRYTAYSAHIDNRCSVREQHKRWLEHALLPAAYERYNRVASRHSIEPRHPYSDKRVIEFCLALPADQKNSLGWEKIINRRAMESLLPGEVVWRSNNSSLTVAFGVERYRLQMVKIWDLLSTSNLAPLYSYVDREKVRKFLLTPPDFTSPHLFNILLCCTMVVWLQQHQFDEIACKP